MRMALVRNSAGVPKFDNPQSIKLFWNQKDKDGNPMLSPSDKAALRTKHNLDERGQTKDEMPEVFVKVDSDEAARAVWKYLTGQQKRILKQQRKSLRDLED